MINPIPDGYLRNAQGHLVPVDAIKKVDLERDALVQKLIKNAQALQASMAAFKSASLGDMDAFVARSAEKYGAKLGGKKGNVSLHSFDGRHKLQLAVSESMHFDERIQAAKELIDECIHEWTKDSGSNVKALIEHAFQTDKEGKLNVARIIGLTKLNITDEKWKQAMLAIKDSMTVGSSTRYLRIYERVGDSDQFQQVSLDLAGL